MLMLFLNGSLRLMIKPMKAVLREGNVTTISDIISGQGGISSIDSLRFTSPLSPSINVDEETKKAQHILSLKH